MIDASHWERLASLEPGDVCRRSGAAHEPTTGRYLLPFLNRVVEVDPKGRTMRWRDQGGASQPAPETDAALVSVVYLLEAKDLAPAGEWVTAEGLRSGSFFFRGPHAIPTAEIARRMGSDRQAFLRAGCRLGGTRVAWGDAAMELPALPRVAVRLVLWLGDDEFPARVTMLFDRRTEEQLPLDAVFGLALYLASAMADAACG